MVWSNKHNKLINESVAKKKETTKPYELIIVLTVKKKKLLSHSWSIK